MADAIRTASGAELIRVPNTLKARIGPRLRIFTAALVRRAEAALEQVVARFSQWLEEEVRALERARDKVEDAALADPDVKALRQAARDLRSSGATFGYPIISRIAASLAELLARAPSASGIPLGLVDAHIDAIRAAIRDNVRSPDHLTASPLCEELEAQVRRATRT